MKKTCSILFFIMVFATTIYGQKPHTGGNGKILFIIHLPNRSIKYVSDLLMSSFEIDKLNILNTTEVKSKFPEYINGNVLDVIPKKNVLFIGLEEILDFYKVANIYRNYSILFEDSTLQSPKDLLASKDYIAGAIVDTSNQTLNIVSKMYEKSKENRKRLQNMPPNEKFGIKIF